MILWISKPRGDLSRAFCNKSVMIPGYYFSRGCRQIIPSFRLSPESMYLRSQTALRQQWSLDSSR